MSPLKAQNRWWIWLPLLGLAAWLAFFADKTPVASTESVNARVPAPRNASVSSAPSSRAESASTTAASNKFESLVSRDLLYPQGKSQLANNDLFASGSWTPPPPPRVAPPILPSPAPTAPALPFTYIGKKLEGSAWEVYVARGEQSFVLRPGSMIESTYRVHSTTPPNLSLIYLPLGQTQTLAIGESQ